MEIQSSMTLSKIISNIKQFYNDFFVIFFRYNQAFLFPWTIGRNALSIVQHGDKFELRINN
jgi:hypothetical protein